MHPPWRGRRGQLLLLLLLLLLLSPLPQGAGAGVQREGELICGRSVSVLLLLGRGSPSIFPDGIGKRPAKLKHICWQWKRPPRWISE